MEQTPQARSVNLALLWNPRKRPTLKTLSAAVRSSSGIARERDLGMRGFRAAFLGFLLVWSTATPTKDACRADVSGWTEVEFRDVITGRYGVDREPVFVSECDKRSVHGATVFGA